MHPLIRLCPMFTFPTLNKVAEAWMFDETFNLFDEASPVEHSVMGLTTNDPGARELPPTEAPLPLPRSAFIFITSTRTTRNSLKHQTSS